MNKLSMPDFLKLTKATQKAAGKVQDDIQKLAESAIAYILEDSNATPAGVLLNAMPKGVRVQALALYLRDFSFITITEKDGKFTCGIDKARREERDTIPALFGEDGEAFVAWHAYSVETPPKPFDFEKAVTALLKKVEKNRADLDLIKVRDRLMDAAAALV